MELREHKLEVAITVLTVLMITGLFKVFSSFGSEPRMENGNVSYEMPRPKTDMVGEFGLGDREIDRRYVNPFEKKKQADAKATTANNVKILKPDNQKKKKAAGQWMAIRKPQVKFETVERSDRRGLGGDDNSNTNQPQNPELFGRAIAQDGGTNQKEVDGDLSDAQWRALMAAQPTQANMDKFIAAYRQGQVSASTYSLVMEDLLKSQRAESQTMAVNALSRVGDAPSFVLLARYKDKLPPAAKAAAEQAIASYGASYRHGALAQVLNSTSDEDVALEAATVILKTLQGQGGAITNPRQLRGQGSSSNPQSFASFRPIMQELSNDGNQDLKNVALQILSYLQSPTV